MLPARGTRCPKADRADRPSGRVVTLASWGGDCGIPSKLGSRRECFVESKDWKLNAEWCLAEGHRSCLKNSLACQKKSLRWCGASRCISIPIADSSTTAKNSMTYCSGSLGLHALSRYCAHDQEWCSPENSGASAQDQFQITLSQSSNHKATYYQSLMKLSRQMRAKSYYCNKNDRASQKIQISRKKVFYFNPRCQVEQFIQIIIFETLAMTSTSETPENDSNKAQYRTLFGAEVLWPLDCPDDILEAVIQEVKNQENVNKLAIDKDGLKITENLKKFLDKNCEPYWHVFMGNNFGCHAMHEKNRFIYFYYKKIAFLIYKAQ